MVDGEPAVVLSTAQIMSGKLQGRGMTAPGRDLLDIAACRQADPEALEIAVNGLADETVQGILKVYEELEDAYAKQTAALTGVPDALTTGKTSAGLRHLAVVDAEAASECIGVHRGGFGCTSTRAYVDADSANALEPPLQRTLPRQAIIRLQ